MIPLADFQPLSIAKTKAFINNPGVLQKDISVHAILIEEVPVQTMLRDGASLLE